MRQFHGASLAAILAALFLVCPAPGGALAQERAPVQANPADVGTYKPVPIILPASLRDPEFDAFRKQLTEVTHKKDRAALESMVAASFFWVPEDADLADKNLSAFENLVRALGLTGPDPVG